MLNPLLAGGVAAGSLVFTILFVLRSVIRFQSDFTDRYAKRLIEQDETIRLQDARIDNLEIELLKCQAERKSMQYLLKANGIEWTSLDDR